MVYLSNNWGMGDSDCMPCYEPVDVLLHHRARTNSTGRDHPSEQTLLNHRLVLDGSATSVVPNAQHRKVEAGNGVRRPPELSVELSHRGSGSGGGGGGGGANGAGGESDGSVATSVSGVIAEASDQHLLLRKPLTPAASEDHHDSDYDEISIHPLSNQVSALFVSTEMKGNKL